MRTICKKIKNEFSLYEGLIEKKKEIGVDFFDLVDHGPIWRKQTRDVQHDTDEPISFGAGKQIHGKKYGLRIFIKRFHSEPVYYFDSDGPAHFTVDPSKGLSGSKIDTPHINYYDSNGIKCAKRTDFIERNIEKLQSDINFGMEYFCDEVNLNKDAGRPQIREHIQTYIWGNNPDDMHGGIDFLETK